MAAAEAERDLMYFTFGDAELVTDVHRIHTLITRNHASVGESRLRSHVRLMQYMTCVQNFHQSLFLLCRAGSVFSMLQQYYERVIKETARAKPQKTLYSFLSEHL